MPTRASLFFEREKKGGAPSFPFFGVKKGPSTLFFLAGFCCALYVETFGQDVGSYGCGPGKR